MIDIRSLVFQNMAKPMTCMVAMKIPPTMRSTMHVQTSTSPAPALEFGLAKMFVELVEVSHGNDLLVVVMHDTVTFLPRDTVLSQVNRLFSL
jgi:hypothetical protein